MLNINGHLFMVAGTIKCGVQKVGGKVAATCGDSAGGSVFKGGAWQSLGAYKNTTGLL